MEKYVLRDAFSDGKSFCLIDFQSSNEKQIFLRITVALYSLPPRVAGYLPDEVLWRQKEQFSDGVGYQWIDQIKNYAASHVSDAEFMGASKSFPHNTPATKEAFFYRKLFTEMFPGECFAKTVMKWVPRTDWGCSADPSGRAQSVHIASTNNWKFERQRRSFVLHTLHCVTHKVVQLNRLHVAASGPCAVKSVASWLN